LNNIYYLFEQFLELGTIFDLSPHQKAADA
jgi:hypothetical protein